MKRVFKIGSKLLAVHFFVLPILFGFHISQHEGHEVPHYDYKTETIATASDCQLCDLIQTQSLAVATLGSAKDASRQQETCGAILHNATRGPHSSCLQSAVAAYVCCLWFSDKEIA